jgi:glyoxylase-like metal-dependent hydrolase (beta-lactamase superfamily II)
MKRMLLVLLAIVLVPVLVLAGLVGFAFIGRQDIVDGFEAGDVRIVQDGFVSLGVVPAGRDRVALVDAGSDKEGAAILAELSRRGLDSSAVAAIFLTHGHPDHTGGLALFPRAEVMALAQEAGLVQGTERARGPLTRFMPLSPGGKVTRPLSDGETVTVGDTEVRVYAVPGHTQGSAAYLVNGVLFVGDAADADSSGKVIGSPWIFSDNQSQDRASLVRLAERLRQDNEPVRAIAFAHSGVRADGLAPLLEFARSEGG